MLNLQSLPFSRKLLVFNGNWRLQHHTAHLIFTLILFGALGCAMRILKLEAVPLL
jgi:hypothetical protein